MTDDTPRIFTHADDPLIPPGTAYLIDPAALRIEAPFLRYGPDDPDPYSVDVDSLRFRVQQDVRLGFQMKTVRVAERWERRSATEVRRIRSRFPFEPRFWLSVFRLMYAEFRASLAGERTIQVSRPEGVVAITGLAT